eukprot:g29644.t1
MTDPQTIADSFEGLEGLNLPVAEFELLEEFAKWDTDHSGKISFDNFVEGLSQMRQRVRALQEQAERNEEQRLLASSVRKAKEAFDNAAAGKELSLEDFIETLSDPNQLEHISAATELPVSFFESLSARSLLDLFKEVDAWLALQKSKGS